MPEENPGLFDQNGQTQVAEPTQVAEEQHPHPVPTVEQTFSQYLEQQTQQEAQPQEQQPQEQSQQEAQPEVDPNRPITYQEFQELLATQQQQTQDPNLQRDAEFARKIYENPEYMSALQNALNNTQQQPTGPEQYAFPDEPTAPRKPRSFSIAAANDNPESASARYLDDFHEYTREHNQWQAEMAKTQALNQQNWIEYQQQQVQAQQAAYAKHQEEQAALERQRQNMQAVNNELMSKHGMSESEANQFIKDVLGGKLDSSPQFLVQAWRLMQQNAAPQGQQKPAAPPLQTAPVQPARSPAAQPAGGLPSNTQPQEKDMLMMQAEYLVSEKRKRDQRLFG